MADDFQSQPSYRHRPARLEFEDAPEYILRKPPSGMPAWVWVLIYLGLGLPLLCVGLLIGMGFWLMPSQAPMSVAPATAPVLGGEIGNDPDLPAQADGFEKIAPPTPDPIPGAGLKGRPPPQPAPRP